MKLLGQPDLREDMGRNAYLMLAKTWNADITVERFVALAQVLLDGKKGGFV